jgi:hypothetical protein
MPQLVKLLIFAAFGAFLHWLILRYGRDVRGMIANFVEDLFFAFNTMMLLEMLLFIGIGSFFAVIMVAPTTDRQALAAGMGWTALMAGFVPDRRHPAGKG